MAVTYILDKAAITLKLKRLALEIAERNTDTRKIILAGIAPNGVAMIAQFRELLPKWFNGEISSLTIELDKKRPGTIQLSEEPRMEDAVVIIVDDVANSGKTLTYALRPFLYHFPKRIETLVLVNRTHKAFPVQPDYVGYSLATTLRDYVEVEVVDGELVSAWVE